MSSGSADRPVYRVVAQEGERLRLDRAGGEPLVVTGHAARGDWVRLGPEGVEIIAHYRSSAPFPSVNKDFYRLNGPRMAFLRERARILAAIRDLFCEQGFLEVETPLVVPSPGLEVHLDAVECRGGYLITSPEYQMKRLLAAGIGNIFQICKCFRQGEQGAHHNPEFTMLEWYRSPGDYEEIARDCERIMERVLPASRPELRPPVERLSMREAFSRFVGSEMPTEEESFWRLYVDRIEPQLGHTRPTILYDWPIFLGALARRKPGDPQVVERFELYAGGVELCNAFGELDDPEEQRARLEIDRARRAQMGKPVYPMDEKFLGSLEEGIPPSAGAAMGLDRLVMLAVGATTIEQVLTFSTHEL